MKKVAVYPGSFNPIHPGHLEIIRQATKLFDKVVVLVATNPAKQYDVCSYDRKQLIEQCLDELKPYGFKDKVVVDMTDLPLVDYCDKKKISIVIKGIRDADDLKSEVSQREYCEILARARTNISELTYTFLYAGNEYLHYSSSSIRQIINLCDKVNLGLIYGETISEFFRPTVPQKCFIDKLYCLYKQVSRKDLYQ